MSRPIDIDPDDDVDDKPPKRIVLELSDDESNTTGDVKAEMGGSLDMSRPYISVDDAPSFGVFNVGDDAGVLSVYYDDDTNMFANNTHAPADQPVTITVVPKLEFAQKFEAASVPVPLFSIARDGRSYLNEVNAIRRATLWALRWNGLYNVVATSAASRLSEFAHVVTRGLVAPVNVPPSTGRRQPTLAETMLALEYVSPFITDNHNVFEQGDAHGFSSTPQFAVGRAFIDADNPDDSVAHKRQNTVNDPDLAPESLEGAAYQHSFSFASGATDAALPFTALAARGLSLTDGQTLEVMTDFNKVSEAFASAKHIGTVLKDTASGTAKFFGRLSAGRGGSRATPNDYQDLLRAADMQFVEDAIRTPIEQVRETAQRNSGVAIKGEIKDRYTTLRGGQVNDNDDQQTRARKALPRLEALATIEDAFEVIVRKDSFDGPFQVRGALFEYGLSLPPINANDVEEGQTNQDRLQSLDLPTGEASLGDWLNARITYIEQTIASDSSTKWRSELKRVSLAAKVRLERRIENQVTRRLIEELGVEDELRAPVNPHAVVDSLSAAIVDGKRRRLKATSGRNLDADADVTVQTTGKEKRKAGEENGPLGSEELREDKDDDEGIDIGEPGINNAAGIERNQAEEGWAMQGVQLRPTVDRRTPWLLDVNNTPRSVLGIPLGWSAEVALRLLDRLYTEARANAQVDIGTLWRTPQVWNAICELALYAKLVPDLGDEVEFPAEARHALSDTLVLVGRRIRNQIDLQQSTISYYESTQFAKIARLRRQLLETDDIEEREKVQSSIDSEQDRVQVPVDSLPSIFTIQFLTEEQSRYVQAARDNEAQGVVYNGSQRMALALMYATVGKMPTSSREPLSVKPLTEVVPNTVDAYRFFPLDRLLTPESIENAFDDATSQRGIVILNQFATDLGDTGVGFVVNLPNLLPVNAGTNLRRLIDREIGTAPLMRDADTLADYEKKRVTVLTKLASVFQRTLGVFTQVKRIYLVLPGVSTDESRGIARAMYNDIFTNSGAFSLGTIIQRHELRIEEIKQQSRAVVVDRGSVLLLANAAQQHVNEHASMTSVALDESLPVRVNFNLASAIESLPDGRYNKVANTPVTVDEAGSRALYDSDQMLGGGRARVSTIPLSYSPNTAVNNERQGKINTFAEFIRDNDARIVELLGELADKSRVLEPDVRETTEAELATLRQEKIELQRQVDGLEMLIEAENNKQQTANEKWVPFFYVLAPFSVLTIVSQIVQDERTNILVKVACQSLVSWFFDGDDGKALQSPNADFITFVKYMRQLARFESDLQSALSLPMAQFVPPTGVLYSRIEMIEMARDTLILPIERARIIGISDELTRPDLSSLLPFSGLAALDETPPFGDEVRLNLRDKMMAIWYRMGVDRSWKRLGYMDVPFNTNRQIVLPNARLMPEAFDSLQSLHFCVRLELRRLVRLRDGVVANFEKQIEKNGRDLNRDEMAQDGNNADDVAIRSKAKDGDNNSDGGGDDDESSVVLEDEDKEEDEGDSDDDSGAVPFPNSRELIEVRRSIIEMRTLLNTIEKETGRLMSAYTLWFDLHVINASELTAGNFAALVETTLVSLYDTIAAGHKIGLVSLLARDRHMPLDPRAQVLIDKLAATAPAAVRVNEAENRHTREFEGVLAKRLEAAEKDDESSKGEEDEESDDEDEPIDEIVDSEFTALITEQFKVQADAMRPARIDPPGLTNVVPSSDTLLPLPTGATIAERTEDARAKHLYQVARYNFLRNRMSGGSDLAKQRSLETLIEQLDETEEEPLAVLRGNIQNERRIQRLGTVLRPDKKLAMREQKEESVRKLEQLELDIEARYAEWRAEFESLSEIATTESSLIKGVDQDAVLLQQARRAENPVMATIKRIEKSQEARRFSLRLLLFADAKLKRVLKDEATIAAAEQRRKQLQKNMQIYKRRLVKLEVTDEPDITKVRERQQEKNETAANIEILKKNIALNEQRIEEIRLDIRSLMSPYQYYQYTESIADTRRKNEKTRREMTSVIDREMRLRLYGTDVSREQREEEEDEDEDGNIAGNLGPSTKTHPPLGRHKTVTIKGVLAAVDLVAKSHVDVDVRRDLELLKIPAEEWDVFATQARKYLVYLIKRSRTIDSRAFENETVDLDAIEDTIRAKVFTHISSVIRKAIRYVAESRLLVDRANGSLLTAGIEDTKKFVSSIVVKTLAVLNERVTGATVLTDDNDRVGLSYVQEAAIVILYKRYTEYQTGLEARETLMALGTRTLSLAFGDSFVDRKDVPVVLIRLLTPAAIERAKLISQMELEKQQPTTSALDRFPELWALAHMSAAPQAVRIAEIVMWYCVAGRVPIPSREAANTTLPYFQYDVAINKKTKKATKKKDKESASAAAALEDARPQADRLAGLGRVLTFDERKKTMATLPLRHSRVSFSCGLHNAQPSSTDLFLSAMCVHMLRFWYDLNSKSLGTGESIGFDQIWRATQLGGTPTKGDVTTLAISRLRSARTRLWMHLVMFFGVANSPMPRAMVEELALYEAQCTMPVFHHMRAVDIRLLALVIFGFDAAGRVDNKLDDDDDDDAVRMPANYAWSRGHASKFILARAFYAELIDTQFRAKNSEVTTHEEEKALRYLVVVQMLEGQMSRVDGRFKKVLLGKKMTATKFNEVEYLVLASLTQQEVMHAIDTQIVSQWTSQRAPVDVRSESIGSGASVLDQNAQLFRGTKLYQNVAQAALLTYADQERVKRLSSIDVDTVVDAAWLHVPRSSLLSCLVTRALDDHKDEKQPPNTEASLDWKRRNIMEALEKIIGLADDSTHLLLDDAVPSLALVKGETPDREEVRREIEAQQQMELDLLKQENDERDEQDDDGQEVATKTPEQMQEAQAANDKQEKQALAAVPSSTNVPSTNVGNWRRVLEKKIRELVGAPVSFEGVLVGVGVELVDGVPSLVEEITDPFLPVPVNKDLLQYANEVMYQLNEPERLWKELLVPILLAQDGLFKSFKSTGVDLGKVEVRDSMSKVREWADNHANELTVQFDSGRRDLFLMLARAELERIHYWSRSPEKLLAAAQAIEGSLYQPWHVLLFDTLQYNSEPKLALTWYITKLTDDTDENRATIAAIRPLLAIKVSPKQKLAYERYVPLYRRLEFLFAKQPTKAQRDKAIKAGTVLDESIEALKFDASEERFDLWAMLLAPVGGQCCLRVQTTDSTSFGATYSWVHPPTMASNTKAAAALYVTNYESAYSEQAQLALTRALRLYDTKHVMVLHSHEFANSEQDKGRAAKFRYASKYTSLARWRILTTTPDEQSKAYTLAEAIARMTQLFKELPNCVSLNLKIPYVAAPLPPTAPTLTPPTPAK
jgi:hypothetical protein